jgi:hypothetical protein
MLFGRAFEQAVGAYFQRQDAAAVLYREWSTHRESGLQYSERDSWDRMLQSGVQLLDRFAQDQRVGIRQPRRNLQVKFNKAITGQNDFVAYVDAIGEMDGTRCLLEWKTTASRYPEEPAGLLALGSSVGLLFLDYWYRRRGPGGICPQATGRDSVFPDNHQRRTARRVRPPGSGLNPKNRSSRVPASQWYPFPPEPLHELSLYRAVLGAAGSDRSGARTAPGSRRPWLA